MKNAQVRAAIKEKCNQRVFSTKYCQNHCVDGIEYNGKTVCGFCRSVPDKIIHYQTEFVHQDQKTVFYKICPTCGDVVRIIKDF